MFDLDFSSTAWLPFLIDVTFKGSLVLLLAGVLTLVLRRASAAARHLIWGLALGSLLVQQTGHYTAGFSLMNMLVGVAVIMLVFGKDRGENQPR